MHNIERIQFYKMVYLKKWTSKYFLHSFIFICLSWEWKKKKAGKLDAQKLERREEDGRIIQLPWKFCLRNYANIRNKDRCTTDFQSVLRIVMVYYRVSKQVFALITISNCNVDKKEKVAKCYMQKLQILKQFYQLIYGQR